MHSLMKLLHYFSKGRILQGCLLVGHAFAEVIVNAGKDFMAGGEAFRLSVLPLPTNAWPASP